MNFRTSDLRTGIIGAKEPPYLVLTRGVKFVHKPMKYSKFLLQTTSLLSKQLRKIVQFRIEVSEIQEVKSSDRNIWQSIFVCGMYSFFNVYIVLLSKVYGRAPLSVVYIRRHNLTIIICMGI